MQKLLASLVFVGLVGGCTASGSGSYSATATTPSLVYVSDDVQVIEDYDQPVFYSANVYWRYDNGTWYSSRYHTRGWVRVSAPPAPIARIERPSAYVHFHAKAQARTERREEARDDRHEMKQEAKEERKEAQQERREEHKEAKQEAKEERKEAKDERRDDRKDDRKDDHRGKDKDDHKHGKK